VLVPVGATAGQVVTVQVSALLLVLLVLMLLVVVLLLLVLLLVLLLRLLTSRHRAQIPTAKKSAASQPEPRRSTGNGGGGGGAQAVNEKSGEKGVIVVVVIVGIIGACSALQFPSIFRRRRAAVFAAVFPAFLTQLVFVAAVLLGFIAAIAMISQFEIVGKGFYAAVALLLAALLPMRKGIP